MYKRILGVTMMLLAVLSGCGKMEEGHSMEEAESPSKSSYGDTLIAESMGVPDHYTFENVSESGKSKVVVDADIIVPQVYGADVIEAIPVVFSDEEVRAFIEQHTGDFEWYEAMTDKLYSGEGLTKEDLGVKFGEDYIGIQSYFMLLENMEEYDQGGAYREINVSFYFNEKTGEQDHGAPSVCPVVAICGRHAVWRYRIMGSGLPGPGAGSSRGTAAAGGVLLRHAGKYQRAFDKRHRIRLCDSRRICFCAFHVPVALFL